MTDRPPVSGEPHGLREAALAVIREWNAGARTGMGLTPMWGAMESLVAALAEAEASTGAALPTPSEQRAYEQGMADGRLVEQAARKIAGAALDVRFTASEWADLFDAHCDSCMKNHRNSKAIRECFARLAEQEGDR